MADRRVTDPTRIAQLLASEVTGRSRGSLGRLTVVDADPDAEPSPGGTLAYRLALDCPDGRDGAEVPNQSGGLDGSDGAPAVTGDSGSEDGADSRRVVGAVHLRPDSVDVSLFAGAASAEAERTATVGLPERALAAGTEAAPGEKRSDVDVTRDGDGDLRLAVRTGAAVKPAVDVLAAVAASTGGGPDE